VKNLRPLSLNKTKLGDEQRINICCTVISILFFRQKDKYIEYYKIVEVKETEIGTFAIYP